jgi:hypothetical protein
MHSQILLQISLVHTAERTKKVTQSCPQPFEGIVMDLANTIAVLIARPNALARRMANADMDAMRLR